MWNAPDVGASPYPLDEIVGIEPDEALRTLINAVSISTLNFRVPT